MENARKKLRICLICVVAAAVVIGMLYYWGEVKKREAISEGTLISGMQVEMGRIWE